MKTDAEYLTEHTLSRYLCPCNPAKRRVMKRYKKDGGRHAHSSLTEIIKCMADYLVRRLRHKLYYFPVIQLAKEIVDLKSLKPTDSVHVALEQLIERDNLHRCRSVRELLKKSQLVTEEMREKDEGFKKIAIRLAEQKSTKELLAPLQHVVRHGRKF